ncbi:MAG: Yip1 family protein, partial [Elusimicrobiota bacterium]
VWGASFFALNVLHVLIANPAALQAYPAWQVGAIAFFGLGLWTALYLLGASLFYGLGRMLGSAGDFDRALLAATVTLTVAPVQAMCNWFPMAWVAPSVLAAWIAACGLSALFKADPWASRGVCAVLAAGVLALQYGAGLIVEKYSAAAQLAAVAAQAAPAASQIAELQQQMLQVQALAEQVQQNAQAPGAAGTSSLDLLRGPAGDATPTPGPDMNQQIDQMKAQGDAMNKSAIAMLDSIAPMLNNPIFTKNMSPQQKSDFIALKALIQDLKTDMADNKISSPQEQQAKMIKVQQLMMRVLSSGMTLPKTAAPAAGAQK